MSRSEEVREIIDRLARLDNGAAWATGLNPTQVAALGYLARANRYSRSPSHLADYLGATRGTVSQTLKSLAQKGYVTEHRSDSDRRVVSFTLTDSGSELAGSAISDVVASVDLLPEDDQDALARELRAVLAGVIRARGGKGFGICRDCRYHESAGRGGFCRLLDVPISPPEADRICHEYQPRHETGSAA